MQVIERVQYIATRERRRRSRGHPARSGLEGQAGVYGMFGRGGPSPQETVWAMDVDVGNEPQACLLNCAACNYYFLVEH